MQASQTPTLVPLAFAANGTKNTIPEASQISITPGAASLNDGFPPLTFTPIAAGGVPPAGADFNGILNLITQTIRWKHAGGQFGYNSAFASDANVSGYPRGALLLRADQSGMWLNQTDGNSTNPDTGGAGWSAAFMSGVVGQARNVSMSAAANSTTSTLTADEIVVGSALGAQKYVLGSFSKTINLATTGAGGMDTGTATASGFLGIYAIYNPTTQTSALLGTMEGAAKLPSVYGGANMPAGYTASALVAVVPISTTVGQFAAFVLTNRSVMTNNTSFATGNVTATTGSLAALTMNGIPYSANRVRIAYSLTLSGATVGNLNLAATNSGIGLIVPNLNTTFSGGAGSTSTTQMDIAVAKTIYWYASSSTGASVNYSFGSAGYEF